MADLTATSTDADHQSDDDADASNEKRVNDYFAELCRREDELRAEGVVIGAGEIKGDGRDGLRVVDTTGMKVGQVFRGVARSALDRVEHYVLLQESGRGYEGFAMPSDADGRLHDEKWRARYEHLNS